MLNFLDKVNNTKKIYSFGKIISIKDSEYTLEYNKTIVKFYSNEIFGLGNWLVFYGKIEGFQIKSEYVECISGVDCTILEKFTHFLNSNIVNK